MNCLSMAKKRLFPRLKMADCKESVETLGLFQNFIEALIFVDVLLKRGSQVEAFSYKSAKEAKESSPSTT